MKTVKILTILTLIFNTLILVGQGHGIGPLILIEVLLFTSDFTKNINILGNYDERIIPFSFFSILVQILFLISFFTKTKKKLLNFSLVIAFLNLAFFTFDFSDSRLSSFSLISSIPFIIAGLILFLTLNVKHLNKKYL